METKSALAVNSSKLISDALKLAQEHGLELPAGLQAIASKLTRALGK